MTAPVVDFTQFTHYSERKWPNEIEFELLRFDCLPYEEWDAKPHGFRVRWFARNDEWLEYCIGSDLNCGKYKYKYRFQSFSSSKPVLVIETREQRRLFVEQFQFSTRSRYLNGTETDWYRVAQLYSAVYMTNDAANHTYTLDVDSLIVLDYDNVQVKLEAENEEGWNLEETENEKE